MNQSLAKFIFYILTSIRGEHVFKRLKELEKNQYLPLTEIKNIQWNKLKSLIEFAYNNSAFYQERFKKVGITPGQINNSDDLLKIPILTKEELKANYKNILIRKNHQFLFTAKTSGSSGIPLKFYRDGQTFGYALAAMYRGHRWHNIDIGAKEALLWGIPVNTKDRLIVRVKDIILNRFREKNFDVTDDTFMHFFKMMERYKPSYLKGYSSMVYLFALFVSEKKLDGKKLKLKMVKCTSESIPDYQRAFIETEFNCPVVSEYGAAEAGIIAFECPQKNYHIMADCYYIEFKNIKGISTNLKKVIVTDLHNYITPIIRYDIGDLGLPSDKECGCEIKLPLLKELIGRTSSVVMAENGKLFHSIIFYYIMKGLESMGGGVKQFKVYQKTPSKLVLEIVKGNNFSESTISYIDDKIKQYLGENMLIDYQFVENITREESGKIRDFVSELSIDEMNRLA